MRYSQIKKSLLNTFAKRSNKIEGVVLDRVCIIGFFLSLTGSGFQTFSSSPVTKCWSSTPRAVTAPNIYKILKATILVFIINIFLRNDF